MSRIVGIDLGTTNSLVAHVEGGIPRVIPDAEGRALLPSIVAWTPHGVVVGEAARRLSARSTWADTSGGVTSRSPMRMVTTSACGVTSKGRRDRSSLTSS